MCVLQLQAGLRILAAGARAGLVKGEQDWQHFVHRFAQGALEGQPDFHPVLDREIVELLDAMISCSVAESDVNRLLKSHLTWLPKKQMRLWRLIPLLTVCTFQLVFLPT
jgi:hypothetical protein